MSVTLAETNRRLRAEVETLREQIAQLQEQLSPRAFDTPPIWRLTRIENRIFAAIASTELASRERVMAAVYSGRDDLDEKNLDVMLTRIRKKVEPFGVSLVTLPSRGWFVDNREVYRRLPEAVQ